MACPHLDPDLKPAVGGEGSVTLAVRDQGAWATTMAGDHWTGLHVSTQSDPARARILRSFESAHTDSRRVEDLTAALGTQAAPALMDSAAKYATLAAGHGELLFRLLSPHKPDYEEKIWDQAAGALLVQEAGGRVTDLRGADLDFGQGRTLRANVGVLASNGALHNAALDALRMTERR
jgi:3'(2'), 5'-bisphosphate nucleotidase